MAGFGRHGILHGETFLELIADLPVEVEFVLDDDEARRFLNLLQAENVDLFYVRFPVKYGFLPARWRAVSFVSIPYQQTGLAQHNP